MNNTHVPEGPPNVSPLMLSLLTQCLQSGILQVPSNLTSNSPGPHSSTSNTPLPTQHASVDDFPLDPELLGESGGAAAVPTGRQEVEQIKEKLERLEGQFCALKRRMEEQESNATQNKKFKLSVPASELSQVQQLVRDDVTVRTYRFLGKNAHLF